MSIASNSQMAMYYGMNASWGDPADEAGTMTVSDLAVDNSLEMFKQMTAVADYAKEKKLALSDCMAYLETVIAYIKEAFHVEKADVCAVSFGGYLVLRYIATRGNPFRKIVLRCPAVNLYESMTGTIMTEEDLRKLEKGKKAAVGFDRKVELDRAFLEELRENDIRKSDFIDFADDLFILHGTADEIIPFPEVSAFADRNCIELLPIPGADHRFSNPLLLEQTTKAILRFFGLE